jgi:hypothetical protein
MSTVCLYVTITRQIYVQRFETQMLPKNVYVPHREVR